MSAKEITIDMGRTVEGYKVTAEVRRELTTRPMTSVTHEELPAGQMTVAITFEVKDPKKRGDNAFISAGQTPPEDRVIVTLPSTVAAKDEDRRWEAVRAVERLWAGWHLNKMRAACAHQVVPEVPEGVASRTSWLLDNTEPCPLTGYRYGTAWLFDPLDAQALADLTLIFNQPRR